MCTSPFESIDERGSYIEIQTDAVYWRDKLDGCGEQLKATFKIHVLSEAAD
jgi:hypothetical protein